MPNLELKQKDNKEKKIKKEYFKSQVIKDKIDAEISVFKK